MKPVCVLRVAVVTSHDFDEGSKFESTTYSHLEPPQSSRGRFSFSRCFTERQQQKEKGSFLAEVGWALARNDCVTQARAQIEP